MGNCFSRPRTTSPDDSSSGEPGKRKRRSSPSALDSPPFESVVPLRESTRTGVSTGAPIVVQSLPTHSPMAEGIDLSVEGTEKREEPEDHLSHLVTSPATAKDVAALTEDASTDKFGEPTKATPPSAKV